MDFLINKSLISSYSILYGLKLSLFINNINFLLSSKFILSNKIIVITNKLFCNLHFFGN